MQQFLKIRWVYHILVWLCSFTILSLLDWVERSEGETVWSITFEEFLFFLVAIYVVYFNFSIKKYFFDKRKYSSYLFFLMVLIVSGTYFFQNMHSFLNEGSFQNSIQQNLINVLALIPISLGLQYFKRGIINQYELQELKVKTAETELNALKTQINPHFLFNTLNNIYGMNQIDSERASEMIMGLSDVMRYHLEFSKKGMVLLEDEIQLLDSYIELEKLRLNNNCDLHVDFTDVDQSLAISPLLILPFVENAFKHGTHPTSSSFIYMKLKTAERKIMFEIKNSIIRNRKTIKTNIGLENTKRRLELIYGSKQKLVCQVNDSTYQVNLIISL